MRLGEECPYITPCRWCTKFECPCDEVVKEVKKQRIRKRGINDKNTR